MNNVFEKEIQLTDDKIKKYFENNKNKYIEIFKSVKIIEINPKKLIGSDEFNDVFFKKLDDIHDLVIGGENLNSIINKYNLENPNEFKINKLCEDINYKKNKKISKELVQNIFLLSEDELTSFIELKDKYYIIEILLLNIMREMMILKMYFYGGKIVDGLIKHGLNGIN